MLYQTVVNAALVLRKEDWSLLQQGIDAMPADVLIPHWMGVRDTALDMTVVNPLQARQAWYPRPQPLHPRTRSDPCLYNWKIQGTCEACKREGMVFVPLP